jgi:hypothetical protein
MPDSTPPEVPAELVDQIRAGWSLLLGAYDGKVPLEKLAEAAIRETLTYAREQDRVLEGQINERERCMDLVRILITHLRAQGDPEADAWARALDWFGKRIKGGHLSILVQQDFDERFGIVDWSTFAASSTEKS